MRFTLTTFTAILALAATQAFAADPFSLTSPAFKDGDAWGVNHYLLKPAP